MTISIRRSGLIWISFPIQSPSLLSSSFMSKYAHQCGFLSVGEPGSRGTKPRPPNTGRINVSSNLRHRRCTVWVGVVRSIRKLLGLTISCPLISISESCWLSRRGILIDLGVPASDDTKLLDDFDMGSKNLMRGFVNKPNT